ncbi:hypothetical protein CL6EHI_166970 [Entamoeba histolytica]|uniref:SPRY domain-containing protein n=3 Tax=Entamoeba histolytica TaxID=5759 RepID=C4LY99_ENTH1|nr:hypothetical protein EHI_166970 [Entamoeba histolytica HM-1:IMSS]EAL49407.1 hypothetical protein EHI_166970 [Entamoeba histolytica HM-1:IMSS]GAT93784.1 hypothetical protein CL6EHI_166970 [Entamoeba histolytica]|eukprot:XP_654793.1 hypothetical protein EHI_166970 [Entamoeba histolytica HM-1:IMSS]
MNLIEQTTMITNIIGNQLEEQKRHFDEWNKEIENKIDSVSSQIKEMLSTSKTLSDQSIKEEIEILRAYELYNQHLLLSLQQRNIKLNNQKYSIKDIVTIQFIDCSYKIPKKYAEKLLKECKEINVINLSGKGFGFVTEYLRGEEVSEIEEEERNQVIQLFQYFGLNWKSINSFKHPIIIKESDILIDGEFTYEMIDDGVSIQKTQNDQNKSILIIDKEITKVCFTVESIGEYPYGYCIIIGCCTDKNDVLGSGVYLPIKGGYIVSNEFQRNEQQMSFHSIEEEDDIWFTFDTDNQIVQIQLNDEKQINVKVKGTYFYPFVIMKYKEQIIQISHLSNN